MSERVEFVGLYRTGHYSMSELCARFGVSRPTGYKWVNRFVEEGLEGLQERSRRPLTSPNQTSQQVEQLIVTAREKHPDWGAITLIDYLRPRHPELKLPAASTAAQILKRHGLLEPKPAKKRSAHPGAPSLVTTASNQVWSVDFKGEFLLRDGCWCFPLTIEDAHSRFLIDCQGLNSTALHGVFPVFETAFATFGLPEAIRSDNGVPFASPGLCGMAQLNVWWTKLGIAHQRIKPGRPQQNGRHERMHRTLKAATALPRQPNLAAQQLRFNVFKVEYNTIRPHRALGGKTPGSVYEPSTRTYPDVLADPRYMKHWEVRRVSGRGRIRFKGELLFLSTALAYEKVGLDEIADGLWSIYHYNRLIARYDEYAKILT